MLPPEPVESMGDPTRPPIRAPMATTRSLEVGRFVDHSRLDGLAVGLGYVLTSELALRVPVSSWFLFREGF